MQKKIEIELKKEILNSEDILINEPLKDWTTWRIGGPVDFLLFPRDKGQVSAIIKKAQKYKKSIIVLGNGSNVLVKDEGFKGFVISTKNLKNIEANANQIYAQAGVMLNKIANFSLENELTGLEFCIGIPATFGGALFMNAGAWDKSVGDYVEEIETVDLEGEVKFYRKENLKFGYRYCSLQDSKEVIIGSRLQLTRGNKEDIKKLMDLYMGKRKEKHPYEMPNAGSVFKNPKKTTAGYLIESVGFKGKQIGGAKVSEKHANFIVNCGDATASDVLKLIEEITSAVWHKHGILLEKEIKIIGNL